MAEQDKHEMILTILKAFYREDIPVNDDGIPANYHHRKSYYQWKHCEFDYVADAHRMASRLLEMRENGKEDTK